MMSQNPFVDRENVSVNTMGILVYYKGSNLIIL